MARVVVIGAGGQIGSDLVPALAREGDEVWMVDLHPPDRAAGGASLARALAADAKWRERWITADAARGPDVPVLLGRIRPTRVFVLTALLSARGEADPALCWDVNMGSLRLVLETAAALPRADRPVVLWPSSIAAFGPIPDVPGGLPDPVTDATPTLPTTMYGVTKVAGELLGAWYARKGLADFRCVRYPGLLNATPPGGGTTDFANEMYFAAVERRASKDFLRADTRLPFMYMPDAVRALLELSRAPEASLRRRVYNVGALSPTAAEIAASIAAEVDRRRDPGDTYRFRAAFAVDPVRQAYADSWPRVIDDAAAQAEWGWRARFASLETMTPALFDEILARARGA